MSFIGKILLFLKSEMAEPTAFGLFHNLWLLGVLVAVVILFFRRKHHSEKQLKVILGVYGITALVLEILKQIIWTFSYDPATNIITSDYNWYAFPFQLCTTPIFVTIITLFMKKGKLRNSLFCYMAFITILGSISTMLIPDSCLVSDILVNIHTMWLHLGSFVVSVYLLMSGEVKLQFKSFKRAVLVFLIFIGLAQALNFGIYHSGILNGETFNMFYISPYFNSTLPVFDVIQPAVPYVLYLMLYIVALSIGGVIIYGISLGIKKVFEFKRG